MGAFPSWPDEIAVFPRHWIWDSEPVFHLHADPPPDSPDFHLDTTRCGIVLFKARRDGTGEVLVNRSVDMRREHAEKFARPCRRCFRQ